LRKKLPAQGPGQRWTTKEETRERDSGGREVARKGKSCKLARKVEWLVGQTEYKSKAMKEKNAKAEITGRVWKRGYFFKVRRRTWLRGITLRRKAVTAGGLVV